MFAHSILKLKKNINFGKDWYQNLSQLFSVALIGLIAAIVLTLLVLAWPAIETFGFSFIWDGAWNPVTEQFGALSVVLGTLLSSLIALLIGIPFSLAIAITVTHILPEKLAKLIRLLIDLMAGIPSIIYGMWGLFVLTPILQTTFGPWLINLMQPVPILNQFFQGPALGIGMLTAGIILSLMIIPTMAAMLTDIILTTPKTMLEAANSLSIKRYAIVLRLVIPYVKTGILGCFILGLGRALGETMAVTFVIGNSHSITSNLFMPGTTIASTIANEFNEATGVLYPAALMEIAILLFLITFLVVLLSRVMLLGYRQER